MRKQDTENDSVPTDFKSKMVCMLEYRQWGPAESHEKEQCQSKEPCKKKKETSEVKVLVAQSCLILCNPLSGSSGILQARILEWH